MPYPNIAAGMRLTAAMLRDMQWQEVTQGQAQVVNNSATLVNSNLIVPVLAGARYMYRLLVGYSVTDADASSDLRVAWSVPNNGEVQRWTLGLGSAGTGTAQDFSSVNFRRPATTDPLRVGVFTNDGTTASFSEHGMIVGGDGGQATLQFAQYLAEAIDLTITASSRVDYLRIG